MFRSDEKEIFKIKKIKLCSHKRDELKNLQVSPLDTGISDFIVLVDFFQYKAPMIDSIHSVRKSYTEEYQTYGSIERSILGEYSQGFMVVVNYKQLVKVQVYKIGRDAL